MIGAPTLDPRQGDRRNKALLQALAARARASTLSRTARTGLGRGARTGVGIRVAGGGGRPSGILSFLSGKAPGAFGPGGVNYVGQTVNPAALVAAVQMPTGALGGGSLPGGGLGITPVNPGIDGVNDPSGGIADQFAQFHAQGGATLAPTQDIYTPINDYLSGLGGAIQTAPSAGIPGGLIPLGGGTFYDPATGQLQGGGLV